VRKTTRRVYARTSKCENDKERYSFEHQIKYLSRFASYDQRTFLDKVYDNDKNKSAFIKDKDIKVSIEGNHLVARFNLNKRPDFKNVLLDAEKREYDELLIWKWDRFSRNLIFQELALIFLKNFGVKVIPTDDTKEYYSRMINGIMNQKEVEMTSKRNQFIMAEKFERKKLVAKPPIGYTYNDYKEVVKDPEHEKLIEDTLRMLLKGIHYKKIHEKTGIPISTIYEIKKNPTYAGFTHYKGNMKKGSFPAYISIEEWITLHPDNKRMYNRYKEPQKKLENAD